MCVFKSLQMQSKMALLVKRQEKDSKSWHLYCCQAEAATVYLILKVRVSNYPSEGITHGKLVKMYCQFGAPEELQNNKEVFEEVCKQRVCPKPLLPHSNGPL